MPRPRPTRTWSSHSYTWDLQVIGDGESNCRLRSTHVNPGTGTGDGLRSGEREPSRLSFQNNPHSYSACSLSPIGRIRSRSRVTTPGFFAKLLNTKGR